MITVLETRDFFEGIFNSPEEAAEYYAAHPEKESCRIIELPFSNYPFFVLEIDRGNFKYFQDKYALIDFIKQMNLDIIPKEKAWVCFVFEGREYKFEDNQTVPALTLYYITEPYVSFKVNEDDIGGLHHSHFEYESLEEFIKTKSLKNFNME